jgi:hypothetical protein
MSATAGSVFQAAWQVPQVHHMYVNPRKLLATRLPSTRAKADTLLESHSLAGHPVTAEVTGRKLLIELHKSGLRESQRPYLGFAEFFRRYVMENKFPLQDHLRGAPARTSGWL